MTIRIMLADDQALMRAGFRALLEAEDDLDVVAEAVDGAEAVSLAARHLPDIALIDVQMPRMDGIEATRRIADDPQLANTRVIILTNYGLDSYIFDALRAGASGFLLKDTEPADLIHAIHIVAGGDALLAPAVTRRLITEFAARPPANPSAGLDVLTPREQEVVTLVAQGLSNEEIASRLFLSPLTAKTHVNRAMTKLHARDRAQLVVWAFTSGLVAV